ncbi:MAG: 2'-5' RNA ligase family protein [Leptothrix sp. (in: b-proteobacteria)]
MASQQPVSVLANPARLFLALWPGPVELAQLVAARAAWGWPARVAPMRAEQLHLTLHFIGAVERQRLDELMAGLAVGFAPFELSFGRAALWPRGLAVLEPLASAEAGDADPQALEASAGLRRLHTALAQALRRHGLPVETRVLRPHVTLARRAAGARVPGPADDWRWPVRGYVLVETVAGGHYRILRHYAADATGMARVGS